MLDAVRLYARRGSRAALYELLASREEIAPGKDAKGVDTSLLDGKALFHGRDSSGDARISIGPRGEEPRLTLSPARLGNQPDSMIKALLTRSLGEDSRVMKVQFGGSVESAGPGCAFPHGGFQGIDVVVRG